MNELSVLFYDFIGGQCVPSAEKNKISEIFCIEMCLMSHLFRTFAAVTNNH